MRAGSGSEPKTVTGAVSRLQSTLSSTTNMSREMGHIDTACQELLMCILLLSGMGPRNQDGTRKSVVGVGKSAQGGLLGFVQVLHSHRRM